MSPARAILPQSPGRKPWGNQWKTFIEPRRGGTNRRQNQFWILVKNPLLSTCKYFIEYDVLIVVSARTYRSEYGVLVSMSTSYLF